jgi:hypothetical protein
MKKNFRLKAINRKAMKTRILLTALMITFSMCVIAEINPGKSEDSLFTTHLASINGSISSELDAMHVLNHNYSEATPPYGSFENSVNLEEWVESREIWEQESSELSLETKPIESVDLEGWIESRESWEQENSEMGTGNSYMETVNLEEWISSRESWEQEASELNTFSAVYPSSLLEEWITGREIWEQENSGTEWSNGSLESAQVEWIISREAWEQK